jgi:hypothetical protein
LLVLNFMTLLGGSIGCSFVNSGEPAVPDFDKTVAPLLAGRCLDCHSGTEPKGGLDLSQSKSAMTGGDNGEVIVPGKLDESRLWELVEKGRMPPKKPLPAAEKEVLKAWITRGAKWGTDPIDPFRVTTDKRAGYDWWALQPLTRLGHPAAKDAKWGRNTIDAFILHRLEEKGLKPSPEADRRTLIRRLSFDLLGLPPNPIEVDAFVKDESPDAYAKLVDRFLASPQYGVRWARHWLDIVRFGESNGFEFDEFRSNAWPYRDWVVDALNRDMSFDEFVRLQLAGDVLRPNDADALRATGFLVAGAYDTAGQTQQSEAMRKVVRQDELEDIVGTVGQTFLGLTVNCARCHDHKFDPVKQVEYYRLTAALGGVRHGERELPKPEKQIAETILKIANLSEQIGALEAPVRKAILADRKQTPTLPPQPLARWDFQDNLKDGVGRLHGTAHANAKLDGGLRLDGQSHVSTVPLDRDLKAKTLEAWVTLDNLDQRGGGVISVQTKDGGHFDALVFGERDEKQWMAGSENFVRTQSFKGPPEKALGHVHMALVYAKDGTITAYRNGHVYGQPYKSDGPVTFKADECEVVFGLRHSPAGGNKMLSGVIHRARLYDRALNAAEVAASAGASSDFVDPEAITARLSADQKAQRERLRSALGEQQARLTSRVYAVVPRQPEVGRLLIRGNPGQPGEKVGAGGVGALAGVSPDFGLPAEAPEAERRKKLAEWITHPKNPLFARVMVNRLWHYHFGVGLVDTPNDFGFNGGRPSHPELLDWLASELIAQKSSLKLMHRLIVLSATYRQSSRSNEKAIHVDANNRLLWRKSPTRLEAEAVRDATLSAAGRLDLHLGGPGFQEYQAVKAEGTNTYLYKPMDLANDAFNRRTLYRTWSRGGRSRLLDVLDCPDPSTTSPARVVTTTPLQALAMLNHAFVLRMADIFSERVVKDVGPDLDNQIAWAYRIAYARRPTEEELTTARRVVEKHGLAILARAIFNSNEFLYVD